MIVVAGPTASGKTDLAVALAERIGAEVVSADSRQVYRRLDAGTAKPPASQRASIRHWMLDCADPSEAFDAARWAREASAAIADIRARGKIALVCGGTGLYLRALLDGGALKWCHGADQRGIHIGHYCKYTAGFLHYADDPAAVADHWPRLVDFVRWVVRVYDPDGLGLIADAAAEAHGGGHLPSFWGYYIGEPAHFPVNLSPRSRWRAFLASGGLAQPAASTSTSTSMSNNPRDMRDIEMTSLSPHGTFADPIIRRSRFSPGYAAGPHHTRATPP
jgi:hypothetical protein